VEEAFFAHAGHAQPQTCPPHRFRAALLTVSHQINSTMQFFLLISLITIGLVAAFMPSGAIMGR
jgi:hypothetical protein